MVIAFEPVFAGINRFRGDKSVFAVYKPTDFTEDGGRPYFFL